MKFHVLHSAIAILRHKPLEYSAPDILQQTKHMPTSMNDKASCKCQHPGKAWQDIKSPQRAQFVYSNRNHVLGAILMGPAAASARKAAMRSSSLAAASLALPCRQHKGLVTQMILCQAAVKISAVHKHTVQAEQLSATRATGIKGTRPSRVTASGGASRSWQQPSQERASQ